MSKKRSQLTGQDTNKVISDRPFRTENVEKIYERINTLNKLVDDVNPGSKEAAKNQESSQKASTQEPIEFLEPTGAIPEDLSPDTAEPVRIADDVQDEGGFSVIRTPLSGLMGKVWSGLSTNPIVNQFQDWLKDIRDLFRPPAVSPVAPNMPPQLSDDTLTIEEGAPTEAGNVLNNDVDDGIGGTLAVTAIEGGTVGTPFITSLGGTLLVNADGSYSYTPPSALTHPPGNILTETFQYTASDGTHNDTATLTVNVTDTEPFARDNVTTTPEDTPVTITEAAVLANDDLSQDEAHTISLGPTVPSNGSVIWDGNDFTYTPDLNFNGTDHFSYILTDADGDSHTATVTITVTPVNDLPTVAPGSNSVIEGASAVTGNVLTNDYDVEGSLTVTEINGTSIDGGAILTTTLGGTLSIGPDGGYSYTPPDSASHTVGDTISETFIYTVQDSDGAETSTTLSIDVTDTEPTAVNDMYTIAEDSGLHTLSVMVNDLPESQDQTVTIGSVSGSTLGAAVVSGDDLHIEYTPNLNAHGTDTLTYTIVDTDGDTATATVTIDITSVNDPPDAVDDTYIVDNGGTLITAAPGVMVNDTDPDLTDTLMASLVVDGPDYGDLTFNPDGSFTYIHDGTPGVSQDFFTYSISDGEGGTDTAVATIQIRPVISVNDVTVDEDAGPATFTVSLSNPSGTAVTVEYQTADGTALAGSDYTVTSGTLVFAPGETIQTVPVEIIDDSVAEQTEQFTLSLSSPINATFGDSEGIGTILDEDLVLAGRVVINEVGLGVGTAPGIVPGDTSGLENKNFIEIRNVRTSAITESDLSKLKLEIVGEAGGTPITINFSSFVVSAGATSIGMSGQAHLIIYDNGTWKIVNAGGTMVNWGTYTTTVPIANPWGFGEDTTKPLAVTLLEPVDSPPTIYASLDAIIANGGDTSHLTDAYWLGAGDGVSLSPSDVLSQLTNNETLNGKIVNQQTVLDALGISRPLVSGSVIDTQESNQVFARVFDGWKAGDIPIDTNQAKDWTTTNVPTEGTLVFSGPPSDKVDATNVAPSDNPQDSGQDDFDPRQGVTGSDENTPNAGQTVLRATSLTPDLEGGRGPDFLYGDDGSNTLTGDAHNDFLYGASGDDVLKGGTGADLLIDVDGGDRLIGESGDDILIADAAQFGVSTPVSDTGDLLIGDSDLSDMSDPEATLAGSDVIIGGDGNDQIFGDNVLDASDPTTSLPVDGEKDWIDAGAGDDVVYGQGGDDEILGGSGEDTIYGGAGSDSIDAGGEDDMIYGGPGDSIIDGGLGIDTFHFAEDMGTGGTTLTLGSGPNISAVEILDMTDSDYVDKVLLSKSAVQSLGVSNSAHGMNTTYDIDVFVKGDVSGGSGDTVAFASSESWTQVMDGGSPVTVSYDGVNYNLWADTSGGSDAYVAIQEGLIPDTLGV